MTSQLDRKRIYGPESSVPPLPLLTELSTRSTTSLDFKDDEDERMEPTSSFSTDFKTPSSLEHLEVGQRLDPSRSIDSIRGLFMQTGVLPQADGSSLIELGQLKLLCAVYGPKPDRKTGTTEKGKLSVSFRFATFANPVRKSFLQDATEKDYSTFLYNALLPSVRLTSFPKSKVDVYVTLLQNDGVHASLASAVTAASLALVDAGIEVMDLVAGSSAGTFNGSNVVMDLTLEEEQHQKGAMLMAYITGTQQVSQWVQAGEMESTLVEEMTELCMDACAEIHSLMSICLKNSAQKKLQAKP